MKPQINFLILLLFIGVFSAVHSQNCPATMNGADLVTAPGVIFPTVTPSVNGTGLDFPTGNNNDLLAIVPLVPAGSYLASDDITSTVTIDLTALTNDNDPIFGFTDGNLATSSGVRVEENAGIIGQNSGALTATTGPNGHTNPVSCGGCIPAVNIPSITISMTFSITNSVVTVSGQMTGTGSGGAANFNYTYPQTYDPSSGINFLIIRQNDIERYRINSITTSCTAPTVQSVVPTLSEWGLILLGLGVLAMGTVVVWRRRSGMVIN